MARQIYTVDAWIVDANGTYNRLSGYPKVYDSKNYGDDTDKAKRRAEGDMSDTWGAFCKRDDRWIQTVTLTDAFGFQLDRKSVGYFHEYTLEEQEQATGQ